jgi:hypothetical protein
MPLPPMTNAAPSPSAESAECPLVSCTAATWRWGIEAFEAVQPDFWTVPNCVIGWEPLVAVKHKVPSSAYG